MFREFNVKFENVDMIGGADNLLENTKVTKVIVRGDNKMSSLDSAFKNCSELDTIDGELDLNNISDIDSILDNTQLVKRINLKNVKQSTRINNNYQKSFYLCTRNLKASIEIGTIEYPSGESRLFRKVAEATLQG